MKRKQKRNVVWVVELLGANGWIAASGLCASKYRDIAKAEIGARHYFSPGLKYRVTKYVAVR